MARANFVKKARKDIPGTDIKAGDSYYWWKFRHGGKNYSKTQPKASQLTNSTFYSGVYAVQEQIGEASADDGLEGLRDDVVGQLEELRDQCQESHDNMPEGLQQGDTGQLLEDRVSAMDSAIDEFQNIDFDEPDTSEADDLEREEGEDDATYEARQAEERERLTNEHWQAKLEEMQGIDIDAP